MEKKQILKVIGENVRNLMNQKGFATTEFARKCKVSPGTISKIVNADTTIEITTIMKIAEGLGVDYLDILQGLPVGTREKKELTKKAGYSKIEQLSIGILSINNKRFTCVKDPVGKVIGTSELAGGLDLAESTGSLIQLINESIHEALQGQKFNENIIKNAKLNLVTQSYEFEDTRSKFASFAKKYFKDVVLLPDWQITYLTDFENDQGISLVTDKGVSLSYIHNGALKKLGGWKFPVYDLGGENWLGVETIRHTIEATEGYTPMTSLARNVLAKFNGKIEKITETCFKGAKDADVYCLFAEPLLRSYFLKDEAAVSIIENGFRVIYRSIERVDSILGKQLKIAINGSLAEIYSPYFKKNRLIKPSSDADKARLLADITKEFLLKHGIQID